MTEDELASLSTESLIAFKKAAEKLLLGRRGIIAAKSRQNLREVIKDLDGTTQLATICELFGAEGFELKAVRAQ